MPQILQKVIKGEVVFLIRRDRMVANRSQKLVPRSRKGML